jgi:tricarballylate dehydrogenase
MAGPRSVVVVGGGNAGLCSAIAAAEAGATVTLVEWAPEEKFGGNSFYAGGGLRCAHEGEKSLQPLLEDVLELNDAIHLGPYTEQRYFDDLADISQYRADGDLVMTLARESLPTLLWLKKQGVRFDLAYRHLVKRDGQSYFTGGVMLEYFGGGQGAVTQLTDIASRAGVTIRYRTRLTELLQDQSGRIRGVRVDCDRRVEELPTRAVVLACGGFEANVAMRAQYLGRNWDLARVRGTQFNMGDGIRLGLSAGSTPTGHWSGCHAVAWDFNAPLVRDHSLPSGFERDSYPYGIVVNNLGRRFIDEGEDFYVYTYAKCGREILRQPGGIAFQIFDANSRKLLTNEYLLQQTSRVEAVSIEELAAQLEIDPVGLEETITAFNQAVSSRVPFDPSVKDGKGTLGVTPRKSNWALPIDTPPFLGFPVTCGITFTFGGLRVDPDAHVCDFGGAPIPGLFAAGELVGGLFCHNYAGGAGLVAGAVFGKRAGVGAAETA